MVNDTIAFINLFLLPIISLYLYNKRNKKELLFNFENICLYSLYLSVGSICNKAIIVIIRFFLTVQININSSYYTAIGVLTFALLPIIFEIIKKHLSIIVEVKNGEK